ncbi:MAG TPA: hypothetical protein GX707_02770 [Epulopiscium sp.]|nr:hypothetical protein [Candidatus Epulonipiscium sp.]
MPVKSINGEIWKDIPNYEGYYQASNIGRVRSLDRWITYSNGQERFYKGGIIKGNLNEDGYRRTTLKKNNIGRFLKFSQLVAMAFLGHEPNGHNLVVDHINGDRSDDRVGNLRIVTNRANITTCFRSDEDSFSSEYAGVNWNKNASKWLAQIYHNGVSTFLGFYDTELEASNAYQSALSKIKDGSFNTDDYKPDFASKHKGVSFHKATNKWQAYITINGKNKYIGLFKTEFEAHKAYQAKLKDIQTI